MHKSAACINFIIIIIIINEYPEAGLWSLFPSNIYILHMNYNKNECIIITLRLPVLHVGFVIITEIPVTAKPICVSLKTADTTK